MPEAQAAGIRRYYHFHPAMQKPPIPLGASGCLLAVDLRVRDSSCIGPEELEFIQ
jgi:hypothetical protein